MRRAALISLVVALVAAGALWWVERPRPSSVLEPVEQGGVPIFDGSGRMQPGAFQAAFSPSGTRMAVITGRGAGVVERGKVRRLAGTEGAVALAWLQDGRHLLVAVGTERLDRLHVIDADAKEPATFVPLVPPTSFGSGHGLTVDSRGRMAVAAVSSRGPVGDERISLSSIDLRTGEVVTLTAADETDELTPFFIDDGRVAFTNRAAREPRDSILVNVIDLNTREARWIDPGGISGSVVGAHEGRAFYTGGASGVDYGWFAIAPGRLPALLGQLDPEDAILAVSPSTPFALVRRADGSLHRLPFAFPPRGVSIRALSAGVVSIWAPKTRREYSRHRAGGREYSQWAVRGASAGGWGEVRYRGNPWRNTSS